MMNPLSRILVAIAALLLSLTYFVPLWQISLDAPQYPEGLGMEIWINQIEGLNPGDLAKINNLNHYIGMKKINPESIPELRIMPWIMRGIMLLGLVAAIFGKRTLLLVWLLIFVTIALVGLVDFYLWGYDYGHNLDTAKAIIKVPGMSYQPPLIGSKKLLNFKAISLPGLGGLAAISSLCIGLAVWLNGWRLNRRSMRHAPIGKVLSVVLAISSPLLSSCGSTGPAEIYYGADQCDYCKMTIADQSFGAELITGKGKIYKYDSIECLAAADIDLTMKKQSVRSRWVTDFSQPGQFINASEALIVATERQRSPMGVGLVAANSAIAADDLVAKVGGRIIDWDEVKNIVAKEWNLQINK